MRRLGLGAIAASLLSAMACSRCGGDAVPPQTDGGADAVSDARSDREDTGTSVDAGCDPDASVDAGPISDWSGWRRLTELDRCVHVDVPLDVQAEAKQLTWIPCTNSQAGCSELETSGWRADGDPKRVASAEASRGYGSKERLLRLTRPLDIYSYEDVVYGLDDLAPRAAWRTDGRFGGFVTAVVGDDRVGLLGRVGDGYSYATGSAATVVDAFAPAKVAPGIFPSSQMYSEHQDVSRTAFVFDVQQVGRIAIVRDGGALVPDGGALRFSVPMLVGDDAFAWSAKSDDGWARYYRFDSDGSVVPYLAKPATHVSGFASDGVWAFWLEATGDPDPAKEQPNGSLWVAPYSRDPNLVSASAVKVADTAGANGSTAIAFDGHYLVAIGRQLGYVVRASDRKVQQVAPGTGRMWGDLVLVSGTELWAVVSVFPNGPFGIGLERLALGAW